MKKKQETIADKTVKAKKQKQYIVISEYKKKIWGYRFNASESTEKLTEPREFVNQVGSRVVLFVDKGYQTVSFTVGKKKVSMPVRCIPVLSESIHGVALTRELRGKLISIEFSFESFKEDN